ncbi:hypothetical protein NX801_04685 [Streptomyces sp. LP05-1]|uniref:Integral membrane protein n=1 Tax=Streptomyces pyxinae TaxID=2970734 RepID=A0ABT2CE98_9ACTN|nr:hypothetical protein [Streptomyces sp. LP05-1]MCS0634969.1 hypothetical protein [Streptomyces sp. LP05-1]
MAHTHERTRSAHSTRPPGPHGGILISFAPWIIFDVIAGPSTWKLAAFTAFVASVVLSLPDFRHGTAKVLNVAGILFFGVVWLLGFALDRQDLVWLETYAQVLSNGVLAVVALASLATVPFTEQYARESVPRELWDSPGFHRTNRVITAVWAAVFLVTAVLGLIALHTTGGDDWLNWVVPVILLVLAIKFTKWYPARVRARAHATGEG